MQKMLEMGRRVGSWTPTRAGVRWLALGCGVLLFVGLALPMKSAVEPGPPAVWVADRDGHGVVGLDGDLFVASLVPARSPVWLAPRPGGFWCVEASGGAPLGPHAVGAWDGTWTTLATGLGPVVDLASGVDGDALCVEFGLGGAPSRVLRVDEGGVFDVAVHAGALCVEGIAAKAPGGELRADLLVGDGAGQLTRYGPGGVVVEVMALGGELVDVVVRGQRAFVLDATGGGRVHVLGVSPSGGLVREASFGLGLQVERLGPTPDGAHVWVVDSSEPLARRYAAGGQLELEVELATSDARGVLGLANGGVLILTPGGLVRLDGAGLQQPGQGGFAYATDLCLDG